MILGSHGDSTFAVIIAISKQPCSTEDFLTEALRILKPDGSLVFYESLSADRKPDTYAEKISRLKLSGFKVKDIEQKNFDTDLESKNLLLKMFSNIENVCKVSANKPSFEVK